MNRAEVEALLFRMNAAIPPRRSIDPVLERARAEEWAASPLGSVELDVADEALDRAKVALDEQPTLRQFLGLCRGVEEARRPPELDEPRPDPDPEVLEQMRELRRRRGILRGAPDDRPTVRGPDGALVHESTAARLEERR